MTDTTATTRIRPPKVVDALPRSFSRLTRSRGLILLLLATGVGIIAGIVVAIISSITQYLHVVMFNIPPVGRLSGQHMLVSPWMALLPAAGGLLMGLSIILARRWRTRPPVDPIEANAVHGGRMSFRESFVVTLQTIISSSFGASVGLEAAYTQMGSALSSDLARYLQLRRNDVRMLVGCGAAGAIAVARDHPNVYLELCGSWMTGAWIARLAAAAGANRVLYGSDCPFIDLRYALGRVVFAPLTDEQRALILGQNMLRLIAQARASLAPASTDGAASRRDDTIR